MVALYREYSACQKRKRQLPYDIQRRIGELQLRPVVLSGITQHKEEELKEIIGEFERLLQEGISKAEAARRLGYGDYPTIWKMYEMLKRIESEKRAGRAEKNEFKESLKNNVVNHSVKTPTILINPEDINKGKSDDDTLEKN